MSDSDGPEPAAASSLEPSTGTAALSDEFIVALDMVQVALDEEPALTYPPFLVMERLAVMVMGIADLTKAALAAREAELAKLRKELAEAKALEGWS